MQAQEKGIDAIMINEDTTHMADIWKRARTTAAMAYLSPEKDLPVPGRSAVACSEPTTTQLCATISRPLLFNSVVHYRLLYT